MASIPATRIARLNLMFAKSGDRFSSVLHYWTSTAISNMELDDFIQAWVTANLSVWNDCLSDEISFQGATCTCVEPSHAIPGHEYGNGTPGNIAQPSLPTNLACVFQIRQTEISGRHNGRIFVVGLPETATADGVIDATFHATELQALATALITPVVASPHTWRLCVLQRFENNVKLAPPVGWDAASCQAVRNMGTQRRRTTELRQFHP